VQVGQFIRLESGEEGTVTKIGWRSTWITLPNNNTIVIPNKTLVNTSLLNYFYPDTEIAVLVGVGVDYSSDLERVERVTVEVAKEVMKEVAGGVPGFEPFIRYHTFADSSINFNAIMRAKDWPSTHLVKHEFIKRLQKRYAKEGISIPYPIRTIVQEK
jgi:small-conductance mechanosensitive channel